MDENVSAKDLISEYIKLRDFKGAADKSFKRKMQPIASRMDEIESILHDLMNKEGAKNIATDVGTAYKHTTTSVKVEDWDAAFEFIRANELWHFIEHRLSKTAVMEYLDEHSELVPGASVSSFEKVNVKR